jgi:hypothetical protein
MLSCGALSKVPPLTRQNLFALDRSSPTREAVDRLTSDGAVALPKRLQQDILDYYSDPNAPIATKRNRRKWKRLNEELEKVSQMKTVDDTQAANGQT